MKATTIGFYPPSQQMVVSPQLLVVTKKSPTIKKKYTLQSREYTPDPIQTLSEFNDSVLHENISKAAIATGFEGLDFQENYCSESQANSIALSLNTGRGWNKGSRQTKNHQIDAETTNIFLGSSAPQSRNILRQSAHRHNSSSYKKSPTRPHSRDNMKNSLNVNTMLVGVGLGLADEGLYLGSNKKDHFIAQRTVGSVYKISTGRNTDQTETMTNKNTHQGNYINRPTTSISYHKITKGHQRTYTMSALQNYPSQRRSSRTNKQPISNVSPSRTNRFQDNQKQIIIVNYKKSLQNQSKSHQNSQQNERENWNFTLTNQKQVKGKNQLQEDQLLAKQGHFTLKNPKTHFQNRQKGFESLTVPRSTQAANSINPMGPMTFYPKLLLNGCRKKRDSLHSNYQTMGISYQLRQPSHEQGGGNKARNYSKPNIHDYVYQMLKPCLITPMTLKPRPRDETKRQQHKSPIHVAVAGRKRAQSHCDGFDEHRRRSVKSGLKKDDYDCGWLDDSKEQGALLHNR